MDIVLIGLWEDFLGKENAQIILCCVKELQEYFGTVTIDVTVVVRVLYGSISQKNMTDNLQTLTFYGAMRGKYSRKELRLCIDHLIQQGYLKGKANASVLLCYPIEEKFSHLKAKKTAKKQTLKKKHVYKKIQEEKHSETYQILVDKQEEKLLRIAGEKLALGENALEGIVGYATFEKSRLYWFYLQGNYGAEYYPVEFIRHSSECMVYCCTHCSEMLYNGIYKLQWKKGTCFLVGLPECRYIKLISENGNNEILFPISPFPFILYTEMPYKQCYFLDENKVSVI